VAYSAVVGPDGRFEISGVVPGSYRLVAQANIPESRGLDRRPYVVRTGTNIEVRNRDVDGIELPLGPSAEVRGRVFVEDALPSVTATPGEPPRIRLRTAGGEVVGPSTGVPASTTGEFVFSHVPRGTYSVELAEPGDRYLERVRIDDTEAEPNAVEINGPAVLDLLVSPNVARIAGTVVRDDGTPVPGASIVLMPASERRTLDRQVMADAAGRFSIGGLAPGEYRIVAGVDFHDFAYFDPGFRTRVGSWTDVVTVVEGEEAELPLRVVPRGTGR
jgi:hypothetical protein